MGKSINPREKRTCEDYAFIVRRSVGWVFGTLMHHYFGDATIILVGAGEDQKDLKFAPTQEWLKEKHVSKYGVSKDEADKFTSHVKNCKNPLCIEADRRLKMVAPLFSSGELPGGEATSNAIALLSVFTPKALGSEMRLKEESGLGDFIRATKPFFKWFTEHPEDWE